MSDTLQNGKPEIDAETFALGPRKPPQLRVVETPKTTLTSRSTFCRRGFSFCPCDRMRSAPSVETERETGVRDFGASAERRHAQATNHAPTIKRWFRDYPDINYGLALLGRTCVDVDVRKGDHWQFELSLVMGFDETPDTLANGSANGGFHIFFEGRDGEREQGVQVRRRSLVHRH